MTARWCIVCVLLLSGCATRQTVVTKYWITDAPEGTGQSQLADTSYFPELDHPHLAVPWLEERASLGFCFGGSDVRAAAMAAGQLYELHASGQLGEARYLSAVSAGAWAVLPYTFCPVDIADDELLALEAVGTNDAVSLLSLFPELELAGEEQDLWLEGLGDESLAYFFARRLLRPLGLADDARFFSFHAAAVDKVVRRNQKENGAHPPLHTNDFYHVQDGRPYLILQGSLQGRQRDVPVEYTPLYSGIRNYEESVRDTGVALGGGYIESYALDSYRPDHSCVGVCFQVALREEWFGQNSPRFTLADLLVASGLETRTDSVFSPALPAFRMWSPVGEPDEFITSEYPCAREGALDAVGLIPLLARGVESIVVFANHVGEPPVREDGTAAGWLAGYFGGDGRYAGNHVFDAELLQELVDVCEAQTNDVVVVTQACDVKENELYLIQPYEVEITWVFPRKADGSTLDDWAERGQKAVAAAIGE